MAKVELIYNVGCPNVESARNLLLQALAAAGLSPRWEEWDEQDPESPAHARGYRSPTILVDGRDVAGPAEGNRSDSCRVYVDIQGETSGVPSIEAVQSALRTSRQTPNRWARGLAILPGIGASVLPVGVCPACWPAYAGLLSSVGLGFLLDSTYLLSLTALLFGVALASLGFRAHQRRGYRPFVLGLGGAAVALIGKFAFEYETMLYIGLGFLMAASIWNSWPLKASTPTSCAACACSDEETQSSSAGNGIRKYEGKKKIWNV